MAAGTSIRALERPVGNFASGEFTLNPASIAAGAREVMTVAVPGARVGDVVQVSPQDALLAGLVVAYARVSANNAIEFTLENHSAGALDQASGKWNYTLVRGSTKRL